MNDLLPRLELSGPDGQSGKFLLSEDRITVGRATEFNDVALEPDPQLLVTRQIHCIIEREAGTWWLMDNGSVNGTFLKRGESTSMVQGRVSLSDGDTIRVLGRLAESGEPEYWELVFVDPQRTQPAGFGKRRACLIYDWLEAKLLLVDGGKRTPVSLRPQEHKLIRYMVQRNAANDDVPVLCTHEELVAAVWGSPTHHGPEDLSHLVYEIRRKVAGGEEGPRLIEAERSMGYRLRTCSRAQA